MRRASKRRAKRPRAPRRAASSRLARCATSAATRPFSPSGSAEPRIPAQLSGRRLSWPRPASLSGLMSAEREPDRSYRHRLRRPGDRCRLRRARQRRLVRRHRRRQDRAPAAAARSRSTSRAWKSCSRATRERLHFSTELADALDARAAAVRRRRHAADLLGRRGPLAPSTPSSTRSRPPTDHALVMKSTVPSARARRQADVRRAGQATACATSRAPSS